MSFSALTNWVWKLCCAVNTLACCSLLKFCDALCCNAVAFDCAIGKAFCIIAFTKASLPIEDLLKPLAAKFFSTFSTAPLAHVGICPVSIPSNKDVICVDTKASVGKEATEAWTAAGCCCIVAVNCAGLLATAAVIAPGNVAVCPATVAAVPLITWAKAPVDNCPEAAWAIAELDGPPVTPVAVPDKLPVREATWALVPTVPCCAVPVCAVPVAPVIVDTLKAEGPPVWDEVPVVGAAIALLVTFESAIVPGEDIVCPAINSFDCKPCVV